MPHMRDQVVLADHALAIADEILQKIENLRLDGDKIGSPPQFLPVKIKRIIFEFIDQAACLRRHYTSAGGVKSGKSRRKIGANSTTNQAVLKDGAARTCH